MDYYIKNLYRNTYLLFAPVECVQTAKRVWFSYEYCKRTRRVQIEIMEIEKVYLFFVEFQPELSPIIVIEMWCLISVQRPESYHINKVYLKKDDTVEFLSSFINI